MGRRSTKKFEFAKGVWYFNIKKGYNNNITIKRTELKKAMDAYRIYLVTQKGKCEWLGKWDGKKFIEDSYDALLKKSKAA